MQRLPGLPDCAWIGCLLLAASPLLAQGMVGGGGGAAGGLAGGGVEVGDRRGNGRRDNFKPGSNETLDWKSWSEAEQAMKKDRKDVLLYIYDPRPDQKERSMAKRYEVNMFSNAIVQEPARLVVCVKLPKDAPNLPKFVENTQLGVFLVSYSGQLFAKHLTPPSQDRLASDLRQMLASSQGQQAREDALAAKAAPGKGQAQNPKDGKKEESPQQKVQAPEPPAPEAPAQQDAVAQPD
jgi:hypothetical protein